VTLRALQAGAAFVSSVFVTALVLHVIGSSVADRAATLGVVALIATPAVALVAITAETWNRDEPTPLLALAVLAVLGVSTAVALITGG
jgi:hypothetical protein